MTEIDLTPITRLEYDIDAILNDHAVAEPITRIELILADIVAGNTTTVEPVTRIETYLAIISGADYPVPEPVTRIETFLAIIAGEDYEEPEAVTRLEGLLAEWVEKGSGIWKTVTGTLIHITDALASPMQKCEVTLEPIQDLHGQDAPYPAGGGVNKFDLSKIVPFNSNVTVTKTDDSFTVTNGNSYVASAICDATGHTMQFPVTDGKWTISIGEATTAVIVVYGSTDGQSFSWLANGISAGNTSATFTVSGQILIELRASAPANGTLTIKRLQLEKGASATPYAPYENICPITGWTGCEVWNDPKYGGLIEWNQVFPTPTVFPTSQIAIPNGTTFSSGDKIIISFNGNVIGDGYSVAYFYLGRNTGRNATARIGKSTLYTVLDTITADGTANNNANSVWVYITNMSIENASISIYNLTQMFGAGNEPSTVEEFKALFPKDYYPYNAGTETTVSAVNGDPYQHLSVTFPDSAGTVYGGTVDLVSGVLTVDKAKTTVGNLSWDYYNTAVYATVQGKKVEGITQKSNVVCDAYKAAESVNSLGSANTWENNTIRGGITQGAVYIKDTRYTSASAFKAACSDVEIVYELAEPITIQLTPQEISTLKGVNNVWSNTNGDTTLIYKAQAE